MDKFYKYNVECEKKGHKWVPVVKFKVGQILSMVLKVR